MSETDQMHFSEPEEEMTVTIETEDGTRVECEVLTIFEVSGQDYIALLPLTGQQDDSDSEDADVWFYRYDEDENDPDAEPELSDIESDEEFEAVIDAFDEYLDNLEFDQMS